MWFMPEDNILNSFRVQFQDMLRSNINFTFIKLTILWSHFINSYADFAIATIATITANAPSCHLSIGLM